MLDLSIITVAKNDEDRLLRTILSLDAQLQADTFQYEHIIIKSVKSPTVGLYQLIHNQARNDYIQRIYHLNDTGIYMAMNYGIAISKAKYILYLNAGDLLYDIDSIQTLSSYLLRINNVQLFNAMIFYSRDNDYASNYDLIGFKDLRASFNNGALICQQSLIYSRKLLVKLGGFDEKYKYAGDYEIICRILSAKTNICSIPMVISEYPAGGLSETKSQECAREINNARFSYSNLFNI